MIRQILGKAIGFWSWFMTSILQGILVLVAGAKRAKRLEKPLSSNLSVLIASWSLFFLLEGTSLLKSLAF